MEGFIVFLMIATVIAIIYGLSKLQDRRDEKNQNINHQNVSSSGSKDYDLIWQSSFALPSITSNPEFKETFEEIKELILAIEEDFSLNLLEEEREFAFSQYMLFLSQNPRLGCIDRQVSSAYSALCLISSIEKIVERPLINEDRNNLMKLVKKFDPIGKEWQEKFSWTNN